MRMKVMRDNRTRLRETQQQGKYGRVGFGIHLGIEESLGVIVNQIFTWQVPIIRIAMNQAFGI
jgi:hypothetical protein